MKNTDTGGTPAGSSEANGQIVEHNPFGRGPKSAGQHRRKGEVEAVTGERLKRWGARRYNVELLDEGREQWKRKLASAVARADAGRDPETTPPTLMFSGDQAVKAGASDEQMAALSTLQPGDVAYLKLRAAAIRRDCRKQVDVLARKIAATRDGSVAPPEPMSLTALLDEPDDSATYRIGQLWSNGGRVLLAAQFKSGKSTLVGNAIRALVDGGRFLDRFDVTPVNKVVLIDTELDTRTLRRWLRDQSIQNTAAVSVLPLRGAVSTFDICDPATRAEWAGQLAGADVVVLDCLRPVLDSMGLSEDKNAGRVLVAFDALLAEIGADEGLVVTHMGHQNERARGDSRLLDWPDALWKIVRGDDDTDDTDLPRYLSAIGRDVALPEGLLTYDTATRHLTYAGGNRKDSIARAAIPELLALIRLEPGKLSKNAAEKLLMDEHGFTQKAVRAATKKAIKDGSIVVTPGPRNAQMLSPGPDPFCPSGTKEAQ